MLFHLHGVICAAFMLSSRVACKAKNIYYLTLYRKKFTDDILRECFKMFNVHTNHLAFLLKCKIGFRRPRPRFSISNMLLGEADAASLQILS